MVTHIPDFGSALDDWLEGLLRLARQYQSLRWRNVHPVALNAGSEKALVGLAAGEWLPTPSEEFIADLADIAEKRGDPFLHDAASGVQRIAAFDPIFKRRFLDLATQVDVLGRFEDGCTEAAVHAHAQLEKLLAARTDWATLEDVLGEGHSLVMDLIIVAWRRLTADPENWQRILTVIGRLRLHYRRSIQSNPAYSWEERRALIQLHASMERMLLEDWLRSAEMTEDVGYLIRLLWGEDLGRHEQWR